MRSLNNEQGFALALIMALLPACVAGMVAMYSVIDITQRDLAVKHLCRQEGLTGQKRVAPLLTTLLSLNPLATALRAQLVIAEAALETAMTTNPAAIGIAMVKVNSIKQQQRQLDARQKQLIKQSNLWLEQNHSKTKLQLRQMITQGSNILMLARLVNYQGQAPRLAVRPDDSDIAPTYSLKPDFTREQALAHEWQYRLSVRPPYSHFISNEFDLKKSCAVTLQEENSRWVAKITKGKSLLKSAW